MAILTFIFIYFFHSSKEDTIPGWIIHCAYTYGTLAMKSISLVTMQFFLEETGKAAFDFLPKFRFAIQMILQRTRLMKIWKRKIRGTRRMLKEYTYYLFKFLQCLLSDRLSKLPRMKADAFSVDWIWTSFLDFCPELSELLNIILSVLLLIVLLFNQAKRLDLDKQKGIIFCHDSAKPHISQHTFQEFKKLN